MTGMLLTQVKTPIIGQAAWLLGKIMDGIFRLMDSVFGVQNIGVTIIILTIVIYTLMIPLTIRQQKFSKMTAVMNPEIQKIQKKYQGKKDQVSMQKMQDETKLVYEKYGVSPTGGCLNMFIQLPFLYAMWYVIRGIPGYVSQVKNVYTPLVDGITATNGWQSIMEKIGEASPVLMKASKYDYSDKNVIIDVLYKFQDSTWTTLKESFPALESVINSTSSQIHDMNSFFGLNISESPSNLIKSGMAAGTYGIIIVAILIPVLSGLSQYLSIKITSASTKQNSNGNSQSDQMAATMKSMNVMFPLMSLVMAFTLPTGLGIYWITSAVVRTIQMVVINKKLDAVPMDELIAKNMEKAEQKRKNKKEIEAKQLNAAAQTNTRSVNGSKSKEQIRENEEKLERAKRQNENAKPGSLADRANMVKRFNEGNK